MRAWILWPLLALACTAPPVRVSVRAGPDGSLELEGQFRVAASPEAAWAVVTDYDHWPRFVGEVRESRVLSRSGSRLVLRQATRVPWLLDLRTWTVRLSIVEEPRSLRFEDRSLADFERYAGRWSVDADGRQAVVRYRLEALPRDPPRAAARRALERSTLELLEQTRAEILRRVKAGRA